VKWLLHEQNILKEKIFNAKYTPESWAALDEDERQETYLILFGDRNVLRSEPTKATSDILNQIKAISLDALNPIIIPDPDEDFSTYTEEDPETLVTVTSSRVTWAGTAPNNVAYVCDDKTADHFDGDFTH